MLSQVLVAGFARRVSAEDARAWATRERGGAWAPERRGCVRAGMGRAGARTIVGRRDENVASERDSCFKDSSWPVCV